MNFGISQTHNEQTGELLSVYFRIRKGKVADTREFAGGSAYADYNKHGELLGVELIGPCKIRVLDTIAANEPADVRYNARQFLKQSIPHGFLQTA